MGRRTWINLALVVLVAALGAVVALRPWSGGESKQSNKPKLTTTKPDTIDTIRLTAGTDKDVTLTRRDAGWHMSAPVSLPANQGAIRPLLDLLTARSRGTAPSSGEAARYGLAEPTLRVRYGDAHTIAIGGSHPVDRRHYVRVDDTIHLVAARRVRALKSSWTAYVGRKLVPDAANLSKIALPSVTLTRAGSDGGWHASGTDAVNAAQAERSASAWINRRASSVHPASQMPTADVQARATLHVRGDGRPIRYAVVSRKPKLQLLRPDAGLVFTLRAADMTPLFRPGRIKTPSGDQASNGGSGS